MRVKRKKRINYLKNVEIVKMGKKAKKKMEE